MRTQVMPAGHKKPPELRFRGEARGVCRKKGNTVDPFPQAENLQLLHVQAVWKWTFQKSSGDEFEFLFHGYTLTLPLICGSGL